MTGSKTALTVGTLATAFIFGGILLYMNFATLAKGITERLASQTLGVSVQIATMDVSLPEKKARVGNIRIGNPAGYDSAYAAHIGAVEIALAPLEKGKPITFNKINVSGVEMNVEVTTQGAINLNDIRKNAQKNKKPASAEAEERKVIIKDLQIGETKLNPIVPVVSEEARTLTMPPLQLRGIGEKENGILAREAIAQIWDKVSAKAVQTATSDGFIDDVKNKVIEEVEGIKNLFGGD